MGYIVVTVGLMAIIMAAMAIGVVFSKEPAVVVSEGQTAFASVKVPRTRANFLQATYQP